MITIHKVTQEDIPEVKQVLSHTWMDTYGSFLSDNTIEKVTTVWHDPEALKAQAVNPEIYFAVAKEEGKIVGLITVRKIDDVTVFMNRLYIHPDYQRQGIGSKLFDSSLTAFPNAKIVRLEVEEENKKGLSFYLKQGFKELERKTDEIEGEKLKSIVMEKEILRINLPAIKGLSARHFIDDRDFPRMIAVREKSRDYDKVDPLSTLESIPTVEQLRESINEDHCDPYKDVLIVEGNGEVIGYNQVSWWTEEDGTWLYLHLGYLLPQWRSKGIGSAMLHYAENHIREIARNHNTKGKGVFGSNATSTEKEKTTLLLNEGYKPVWTLAEFEFTDFNSLSEIDLPDGFVLKPVLAEHLRSIYEANDEVYQGTWGYTPKSEEGFQEFIENIDSSLWQVAWDGNQIAGFVLGEIENGHGEISEVSVRKSWRRRGLAYALLVKSLKKLQKRGITVVRLHTDAEGKAGARPLYEKTGFIHLKDSVRYRKPIEVRHN